MLVPQLCLHCLPLYSSLLSWQCDLLQSSWAPLWGLNVRLKLVHEACTRINGGIYRMLIVGRSFSCHCVA